MARSSACNGKILLGVSGGIAAYKSAELVRILRRRGFRVQVVMTRAARQFVAPLTFAALSGEQVITDLFPGDSGEPTPAGAIEHIAIAQRADLLVVAPATANILAKFAHGLADDSLTTAHLAFTGPIVVSPAMNTNMWSHPATVENLALLRKRGVRIVEPDEGDLACGMVGPGRLAEPERIADAVEAALGGAPRQELSAHTVLITAGPTREPIDPVRYLSNRSSGRMGFALAAEARARGARVILISGPVSLTPPEGCEIERVETAAEMREAVLRRLPETTAVIMAAAVADFRPAHWSREKIKKSSAQSSLELTENPDILRELGERKNGRLLVGFAAETGELLPEAERKLKEKNCDFLIANPVGEAGQGAGIDSDENQGLLLTASGERIELPRSSKREMAARILDRIFAG